MTPHEAGICDMTKQPCATSSLPLESPDMSQGLAILVGWPQYASELMTSPPLRVDSAW